MGVGIKVVLLVAFALLAMTPAVPSHDAAQASSIHPAAYYKKYFADPIMGIRGDAHVLAIAIGS